MISGIGKYLDTGFYESRGDIFDSALLSYKDNSDESQNIISKLMVESGFRDDDNCYIDLEKEFFESGGLDRDKSDNFKKELILYYSLNHLKYVFNGTTSLMTRITGDTLKREGKDLNDYLPVEQRRKRVEKEEEKENKKLKELKKENKVPIYVYSDASLSTRVDKEKSQQAFNRLGGTGGSFDFSKGYDPNHQVKNKTFMAGFNKNGVWEKIEENTVKNRSVEIEPNNSSIQTDVELLFDQDLIYLIDNENLLQSGIEEEYFSVSGDLYARREIDKKKSIDSIKEALTRSGSKALKTVVLKDNNKESVNYYKENFKEFITPQTVFTTVDNKETQDEISSVKNRHVEEQLSRDVLTQFL